MSQAEESLGEMQVDPEAPAMESAVLGTASLVPRVAAYITAYRDPEALNHCIAAIQAQSYSVEKIVIVDNSPQQISLTTEQLLDKGILIWFHPENIGIAGGLQLAVGWATEQGYDFLWTFDQDSAPMVDCLKTLIDTYRLYKTDVYAIGIVAPTPMDARTGAVVKPSNFLGDRFRGFDPPNQTTPYECDVVITSGSLLWMGTTQQVSPPDSGLFIDGIDLDYGLRLRRAGFHNLMVPNALMHHRFGTPLAVDLFGRKKVLQLYSPLRHYYICRNHTYLELQYSSGWYRLSCYLRRFQHLLISICCILLFDPDIKARKIHACLIGTYHGLLKKMGKTWQESA